MFVDSYSSLILVRWRAKTILALAVGKREGAKARITMMALAEAGLGCG